MWKCSKCGEKIEDNFDACWNCGTSRAGTATVEPEIFEASKREVYEIISEHRYPALRTIAGLYRTVAAFAAGLSILGGLAFPVLSGGFGLLQLIVLLDCATLFL